MQIKKSLYKVKGMNKDLSYSAFNKDYSFDNKNIRILNSGENSTLSISNEKGTLKCNLSEDIRGQCIASSVINDKLVLFTQDSVTETLNGLKLKSNSINLSKLNLNNEITVSLKLSNEILEDMLEIWGFTFKINVYNSSFEKVNEIQSEDVYVSSLLSWNLNVPTFTQKYNVSDIIESSAVYYSISNVQFFVWYDPLDGSGLRPFWYKPISNLDWESNKTTIDESTESPIIDDMYNGATPGMPSSGIINTSILKDSIVTNVAVSGDDFVLIGDSVSIESSELIDIVPGTKLNIDFNLETDFVGLNDNLCSIDVDYESTSVVVYEDNLGALTEIDSWIIRQSDNENSHIIQDLDPSKKYQIKYYIRVLANPEGTIDVARASIKINANFSYQKYEEPIFVGENIILNSNCNFNKIYSSKIKLESTINNKINDFKYSLSYSRYDNTSQTVFGYINSDYIDIESMINGIFNIRNVSVFLNDSKIYDSNIYYSYSTPNEYAIELGSFVVYESGPTNIEYIYVLNNTSQNNINVENIFYGNLNITNNSHIQTLPIYENDLIQKVYWVDGVNQPRVINIENSYLYTRDGNVFNFSRDISSDIKSLSLSTTKVDGGGMFKSGTIQYAVSYFNLNGQESGIVSMSDVLYISPFSRGGKKDEVITNSFKIDIDNVNNNYDYIRIYSIYRDSLDSEPSVKIVSDIKTTHEFLTFIDNGNIGSSVDSDILLYIGGDDISAKTISQKANTLFVGNVSLNSNEYPGNKLDSCSFRWYTSDPILIESINDGNNSYPYKPKSLNQKQFDVRHFKFNEIYRFGIQGQYKNGKWSQPIYIGSDKTVDKRYSCSYNFSGNIQISPVYGEIKINSTVANQLISLGFINIRPVMAIPSLSDKRCIAQSLATNTLSTLKDRYKDNIQSSVFSKPDYLTRFNSDIYNGKFLKFNAPFKTAHSGGWYLKDGFWQSALEIMAAQPDTDLWYGAPGSGAYVGPEYLDNSDFNIYTYNFNKEPLNKSNIWFIDTNIINLWSPEFEYDSDKYFNWISTANKISLYGVAHCTGYSYNLDYDYSIEPGFTNKSNRSSISNYGFSPSSFYDSFSKNNWGLFDSNPDGIYSHWKCKTQIPMWSPSELHLSPLEEPSDNLDKENYDIDVSFTKIDRYNINYFGFNNILKDTESFVYDINRPSICYDDSINYIESNSNDNSGSVLYCKNVDELYPALSYQNTIYQPYNSRWFKRKNSSSMFVKYNSSNHCTLSLKNNQAGNSIVLPLVNYRNTGAFTTANTSNITPFWRTSGLYSKDTISRDYFKNDITFRDNNDPRKWNVLSTNNLLIFDLIKDVDELSVYGGNSDSALLSNKWIKCGNSVVLEPKETVLLANIGDTYIRRFDVLKTYPNDENQIPAHKEALSFICESLINTDGRCDVNRYNGNINLMSKSNYGLLNNSYTQKDNYFIYSQIDYDRFRLNKFNNTILFSKTKQSGELVDKWTNLTMTSSFDANGLYGELNSINLSGNELFAFQSNGISRILFNERVQSVASDNISIELSNGYKTPEVRYLTNQYGCTNFDSIVNSKSGLYFIDYKNKSLNLINSDGIKDISTEFGFKNWFKDNTSGEHFNLSYDNINNELYIHNNEYCLNFSEILNSFQSFYDYVNTHKMYNIWNKFISTNKKEIDDKLYSNIWLNNEGDYNSIYGEIKPFYIEYIFNPDEAFDKIFDSVEYRLNNNLIDFNALESSNWYQSTTLNNSQYNDKLRKKFNVNRLIIPRQTGTYNRMRSTWLKFKLKWNPTNENNNNRFSMEDLNIVYTI